VPEAQLDDICEQLWDRRRLDLHDPAADELGQRVRVPEVQIRRSLVRREPG
jgi:hypothetical protein